MSISMLGGEAVSARLTRLCEQERLARHARMKYDNEKLNQDWRARKVRTLITHPQDSGGQRMKLHAGGTNKAQSRARSMRPLGTGAEVHTKG
jgi:hypothetical protein